MNSFVSNLIQKMTLEEKIGQLNLPSPGYFTTDSTAFQLGANNIKNGNIGGVYNIRSIERIKEIQRIAVEESRLKIPLIFGMDVIHGYKTIFPIPIALSCTWDMDLIEKSARIATVEASAEGVNWTFSPMSKKLPGGPSSGGPIVAGDFSVQSNHSAQNPLCCFRQVSLSR